MVTRMLRVIVLALSCIVTSAYFADAQPIVSGMVHWYVTVDGADAHVSEARSYRIDEPVNELALTLFTFNGSAESILVNLNPRLVRVYLLRDGIEVRPVVDWHPSIERSTDSASTPAVATDVIPLESRAGFGRRLTLSLPDRGRFPPSDYEIRVEVDPSRIRAQPATTTNRIHMLSRFDLKVAIGTPSSGPERLASLRKRGQRALAAGRVEEAMSHFKDALRAAPNDSAALVGLGNAYLTQRMFRDAIDSYERALQIPSGGRSAVPALLAAAYVGIGDENGARRVLASEGRDAAAIEFELRRLRDRFGSRIR